jgi:hypothetical protein
MQQATPMLRCIFLCDQECLTPAVLTSKSGLAGSAGELVLTPAMNPTPDRRTPGAGEKDT